jgi:hypothetical protein
MRPIMRVECVCVGRTIPAEGEVDVPDPEPGIARSGTRLTRTIGADIEAADCASADDGGIGTRPFALPSLASRLRLLLEFGVREPSAAEADENDGEAAGASDVGDSSDIGVSACEEEDWRHSGARSDVMRIDAV